MGQLADYLAALRLDWGSLWGANGQEPVSGDYRKAILLDYFLFQVENGGIEQWYCNPSGILADETVEAIESVPLPEVLFLTRKFLAMAPKVTPNANRAMVIMEWSVTYEDQIRLIDEQLFELLPAMSGEVDAWALRVGLFDDESLESS